LQEAHRVLKPDGILILTVPYINLARKTEDILLKICGKSGKEWESNGEKLGYTLTREYEMENSPFKDLKFFQYIHEKKEIMDIVQKAGYEIISYKGIYLLWGLADFLIFKCLFDWIDSFRQRSRKIMAIPKEKPSPSAKVEDISPWKRLMKKFIVEEDERIIIFRPIISILQRTNANSLMLICKVKK
jgi:SAM-dependent methyltransferase